MVHVEPPPPEFVTWIEDSLGLHDEAKAIGGWAKVLKQRLSATQSPTLRAYCQLLNTSSGRRDEVAQLAPALTVGETYFFRDSRQFEALTTTILPELLHRRGPLEVVRVLSVACSTGEEPYSIAIAAREHLGVQADRIQIHAFDVNPVAIANAQQATYSEWSLRATPAALRSRYFARKGNSYALDSTTRKSVTFEVRNLFDPDPEFYRAARFDVILFRNALIYFSRRKIAAALSMLTDTLAPDGVIFLGNAETPRGFENRLLPREVCGSFCYQIGEVRTAESQWTPSPVTEQISVATASEQLAPQQSVDDSANDRTLLGGVWVSEIDAATKRLATLVNSTSTLPHEPVRTGPGVDRNARITEARELVARERFGEALARLDELVAAGVRDGQIDLLRATILTNQGRFVEACDICRRLVVEEPHLAGAYHLLGVASEQLGLRGDARRYHESAITLDPGFAMSHWLLGRLSLSEKRPDEARRRLSEALRLWQLEANSSTGDADLYTGGFGRKTLMQLCRSDLARCEVRR